MALQLFVEVRIFNTLKYDVAWSSLWLPFLKAQLVFKNAIQQGNQELANAKLLQLKVFIGHLVLFRPIFIHHTYIFFFSISLCFPPGTNAGSRIITSTWPRKCKWYCRKDCRQRLFGICCCIFSSDRWQGFIPSVSFQSQTILYKSQVNILSFEFHILIGYKNATNVSFSFFTIHLLALACRNQIWCTQYWD